MPRVVGPIRKGHSVLVEDVRFLRAHTDRLVKVTVPGPFTMTQQAHNDYYADEAALALAYADCGQRRNPGLGGGRRGRGANR